MSSDYAVIVVNNTKTNEVKLLVDCFFYDKDVADQIAKREAATLPSYCEVRVCHAYCTGFYSNEK